MSKLALVLAFGLVASLSSVGVTRGKRLAAGAPSSGFSTYLGGNDFDRIVKTVPDGQGNVYVVGGTESSNFPGSKIGRGKLGAYDIFVVKYTEAGSVLFSAILGGKRDDYVRAVTVDGLGNLLIAGTTSSKNFPTVNAYQKKYRGLDDVFLTKLGSNGQIVFSTLLGGTLIEEFSRLEVDAAGSVYVGGTTTSPNFPTTHGAYGTRLGNVPNPDDAFGSDGFVAKFTPDGVPVYSTYIGGRESEGLGDFHVLGSGDVIVAGTTSSANVSTVNALQPTLQAYYDGYVVRLGPTGIPMFATYLGGTNVDQIVNTIIDSEGNLVMHGDTKSADFPTRDALQATWTAGSSFVTKLDPSGGLVYSTFLGGTNAAFPQSGLVAGPAGSVYVFGSTSYGYRQNFPFVHAVDTVIDSGYEMFVTKFDRDGRCVYSTALGGDGEDGAVDVLADSHGNFTIVGESTSADFPTFAAYQPVAGGRGDLFVTKFDPAGALVFSTYLGGEYGERLASSIIEDDGSVFTLGVTSSDDIHVTPGSLPRGGQVDLFLTRLSPEGSPVYVTYLGGNYDEARYGARLAIDGDGGAYVAGDTSSTVFPLLNAVQSSPGGRFDTFLSVFNPQGQLRFSTFVGGALDEIYFELQVVPNGEVYLWGQTDSADFPTRLAAQSTFGGVADAVLVRYVIPSDREFAP